MGWGDLLNREQPQPDATFSYGDDRLHVIDVWQPEGDTPAPAVIMIHGGCWQTRYAQRDIMNWIADDLRKHGVGVWNIEYRGVDRGGGYPETYEDVGKAADLFFEKAKDYQLKTDQVIAIGHSAGGHLALWLANRPMLPKDQALRGDSPIVLDVAISQGGLPDLREGAMRDGHACGTDAPQQMAGSNLTLTSPPEMLAGKARQVLFHNSEDGIAPPRYARDYINAMAQKGTQVKLIETPAEGHVELIAPESKSWSKQRALILSEFGLE